MTPPDLYESAMRHLSRYAATQAGMARVLARKLERWAAAQEDPESAAQATRALRHEIPGVIARLVALGAINDAAFAESRARRLTRTGKSARATAAHLAAKGVRTSVPTDEARELAAACAYLRRRRAGPFGDTPHEKILAAMARGGFSQNIAHRALRLERDEAEALIKSIS
jgi:regulatory protein